MNKWKTLVLLVGLTLVGQNLAIAREKQDGIRLPCVEREHSTLGTCTYNHPHNFPDLGPRPGPDFVPPVIRPLPRPRPYPHYVPPRFDPPRPIIY